MKERNLRGVIAVALGVCLSVGLFATNAIAKPAPVTKIRFKLDDHNVPPGSAVTSDVLVRTRSEPRRGFPSRTRSSRSAWTGPRS